MFLFIGAFVLLVLAVFLSVYEGNEAKEELKSLAKSLEKIEESTKAITQQRDEMRRQLEDRAAELARSLEYTKGRLDGIESHSKLLETLVQRPVAVTIIDRRSPQPKRADPAPVKRVKVPKLKTPDFLRSRGKKK